MYCMTNSGDFLYRLGVIKFKYSDSLASWLKKIVLTIYFKDHNFSIHMTSSWALAPSSVLLCCPSFLKKPC